MNGVVDMVLGNRIVRYHRGLRSSGDDTHCESALASEQTTRYRKKQCQFPIGRWRGSGM